MRRNACIGIDDRYDPVSWSAGYTDGFMDGRVHEIDQPTRSEPTVLERLNDLETRLDKLTEAFARYQTNQIHKDVARKF